MDENLLQFYKTYQANVRAYQFAMNVIYFDQATIAPKQGATYANEMMALLAGEHFSYATNPDHIANIEQLYAQSEDELLKKEIALRLRELHQISLLPKDVYVAFQKAISNSERCWEQAKAENNYELFKPHLLELIKKQKELLSYFTFEGSSYDYLLDQYQIGMNQEKYDRFFDEVKAKLVPLIQQIAKKQNLIDDSLLHQTFAIDKQQQFTEVLKDSLDIKKENCYLTTSVHPFTSFFSANDVRITTRYHEHNPMSAILATIHEYGHALYGLQTDKAYEGTTLADNIGFAMHESQSRLLENHIGRNKGFWQQNYPKLQDLYPEQLKDVTLDSFLAKLNIAKPSLIRIEADELTYPLHILIRYELEKQIFNDEIDLENLDVLWADKYEEYLGVRPQRFDEGILQDMHWSAAAFGYFPSYALGSAFSAQFYNTLQQQIDVEKVLANNDFATIADWLKENIHQYGAAKTFEEILESATGEQFNPTYYIHYLVKKYKNLYDIQ